MHGQYNTHTHICTYTGMVTPSILHSILQRDLGIHVSLAEIKVLWASYDTSNRGALHIRTFAERFIPRDMDGTHHLTPKSQEEREMSSSIRSHLFNIMGRASQGSSLVGTHAHTNGVNSAKLPMNNVSARVLCVWLRVYPSAEACDAAQAYGAVAIILLFARGMSMRQTG